MKNKVKSELIIAKDVIKFHNDCFKSVSFIDEIANSFHKQVEAEQKKEIKYVLLQIGYEGDDFIKNNKTIVCYCSNNKELHNTKNNPAIIQQQYISVNNKLIPSFNGEPLY